MCNSVRKRVFALGALALIAGVVAPVSAQHAAAKPAAAAPAPAPEAAPAKGPQPTAAPGTPPTAAEGGASQAQPDHSLAPAYPPGAATGGRDDSRDRSDQRGRDDYSDRNDSRDRDASRDRDNARGGEDYRGGENYRGREDARGRDDYRSRGDLDDYRDDSRAARRERRARERYELRLERERHPRRSRGMLIGGIAMLAAGYIPPAFIGVAVGTRPRETCDCRDALRLAIPLVGPLTLWKPDRDFNVFFNGLMLIDSLIQTAGLVLTIFGAIRYAETAEEAEYGQGHPRPKPALSFGAAPAPGGLVGNLRLQL